MKKFMILVILLGVLSVKGLSRDSGHTIIGATSVALSEIDNYSISPADGTSYSWSVTNGTITGGQGTATVTIQWSNTAGPGQVQCNVDNGLDVVVLDTNVGHS